MENPVYNVTTISEDEVRGDTENVSIICKRQKSKDVLVSIIRRKTNETVYSVTVPYDVYKGFSLEKVYAAVLETLKTIIMVINNNDRSR